MKEILQGTQVPGDFHYFRSTSPVYKKYLESGGLTTIPIGKQYGWIKSFYFFQIAKFERTDEEPTEKLLRKFGFVRGLVLWVPAHKDTVPKPWKELWIPGSHFTSTGIGKVRPSFYLAWNERAKRARKKFLSFPNVSVRKASEKEFTEAFSKTRVRHPFRSDYIRYYSKMCRVNPKSIQSFLAYEDETPIAGLAVHNF